MITRPHATTRYTHLGCRVMEFRDFGETHITLECPRPYIREDRRAHPKPRNPINNPQ